MRSGSEQRNATARAVVKATKAADRQEAANVVRGYRPAKLSWREQGFREAAENAAALTYAPRWVDVEGVHWALARVVTGSERRVVFDLDGLGFRVYTPLRRSMVLQGRVRGSAKRVKRISVAAAFPGYVFVGSPGFLGISKAMHDRVIEIVGASGAPLRILAKLISEINQREAEGHFDQVARPVSPVVVGEPVVWAPLKARAPFAIGEPIRMAAGPFAGLTGAVAALPADLRVAVELTLFGRPMIVKVDACRIEKAVA